MPYIIFFFSWFSFVRIYAKNPKCKLATLIRILCVVLCDGRFGQVCTVCLHLYARTWFDIDNKRRYWYTFGTKIMKKKIYIHTRVERARAHSQYIVHIFNIDLFFSLLFCFVCVFFSLNFLRRSVWVMQYLSHGIRLNCVLYSVRFGAVLCCAVLCVPTALYIVIGFILLYYVFSLL